MVDRHDLIAQEVEDLEKKYSTSESNLPATAAAGPKSAESTPKKELMVDRQELIAQEIEDLEEKYFLLVSNAESAMAEANPPQIKLKRFSKYWKKVATTVEELFDRLEPFNFLEYALLEKIVKFFLSQAHTVADDLRDYRQQFNQLQDIYDCSAIYRQY